LDSLFPIFCLSCQKEGFWLCEKCLGQAKILDFQVCPVCEKNITDKGFLCSDCQISQKSPLTGLISAISYENPGVKHLVHHFKYRFISGIAEPLAKLIFKAWLQNDGPLPDFLTPVPLHPRRLRWRGFNQSLLLAEKISSDLAPLMNLPVLDILERKKYNQPQMNIKNYQERLENVKGIFGVKSNFDKKIIKNKTILIIDDIATTGATIFECAKVLKVNGAKKVFAAVVARQSLINKT